MFAGLSSLTKLAITGFEQLTRIVTLPASLEHIELSHNAIFIIEPDAFHLLNKLKHLSLNVNKLTAETAFPCFGYLAYLEHLNLHYNNIYSLKVLNSIGLPRLRVLNLSNNKLEKLSKQTFASLPGLVNLNLGYNEITEIEPGAFDGLLNLRVLNLDNIELEAFYFDVFDSAVNNLGSPVNMMHLSLITQYIESVQWSSEMPMDVDELMFKAKKKRKLEADEAARLFGKCGFRNELEIKINFGLEIHDRSFLNLIAERQLIRLSLADFTD
jgi:Leucine-rich repeat (LRR) protein